MIWRANVTGQNSVIWYCSGSGSGVDDEDDPVSSTAFIPNRLDMNDNGSYRMKVSDKFQIVSRSNICFCRSIVLNVFQRL